MLKWRIFLTESLLGKYLRVRTSIHSITPYSSSAHNEQPKVVIVGAGMAGLTAAQTLHDNKFRNVKVFEASNRYGGRIQSEKFGDAVCQLGAKDSVDKFSKVAAVKEKTFRKSSGDTISSHICTAAMIYFKKLKEEVLQDAVNKRIHFNMYDSFAERIKSILKTFPENSRQEANTVFFGLLNTMRSNFGTDLQNVHSFLGTKKLKEINDQFEITANYGPNIQEIVNSLPPDFLSLDTPINKIEWATKDSRNVVVHNLKGHRYMADYVISTLPLGVLKSLGDVIFDPPLSYYRTTSINSIGVGQIEKIFLLFGESIDKWFTGPISLACQEEDLFNKNEWVSGVSAVTKPANSQSVLEITVAGSQAEDMRLVSDDKVSLDIVNMLKKFLGNPDVPHPKDMLRSNWTKDAKFLGSLSYPSTQTTTGHLLEIQDPLDLLYPRLLFAGEATVPSHLGTVFGARLSGIREADRIIQYTKNKAKSKV